MAFLKKILASFCIIVVVSLVVVPLPSSKNFTSYFRIEKELAQSSVLIQGRRLGHGYGGSLSSSSPSLSDSALKDSAREVPRGPDPLHHKNNPSGH